ncbi:hypothetical protein ZIOFF_056375 [Zingiber officinale]|uniref:Pentatricopeptide repeat-containing protein n=1 Tax=Zingiber officinale TaxID=94328 RepID=A0A8J5FI25_ZINOF|nr:hypothetical protein ZIOFF_056375 [Zingiber officinale]
MKACWDLEWGKQIHSLACKHGFVCNVFVSASFVHMYSRLGFTDDARKVFDEMKIKDLDLFVSNALIDMYVKLGHLEEA